jgi:hypothetical protein
LELETVVEVLEWTNTKEVSDPYSSSHNVQI